MKTAQQDLNELMGLMKCSPEEVANLNLKESGVVAFLAFLDRVKLDASISALEESAAVCNWQVPEDAYNQFSEHCQIAHKCRDEIISLATKLKQKSK